VKTVFRLDSEQRAVAAIARGPVRVVAGAGTGKTAVIAERFRRLPVGVNCSRDLMCSPVTTTSASISDVAESLSTREL